MQPVCCLHGRGSATGAGRGREGGAVAYGRRCCGQGRRDWRMGGKTARLRSGGFSDAAVTGTSGQCAPLAPSATWRHGRRNRRASVAPTGLGMQRRWERRRQRAPFALSARQRREWCSRRASLSPAAPLATGTAQTARSPWLRRRSGGRNGADDALPLLFWSGEDGDSVNAKFPLLRQLHDGFDEWMIDFLFMTVFIE